MSERMEQMARDRRAMRICAALTVFVAAPALGQGANPWSPQGTVPPAVYAGDGAQSLPGTATGWGGGEAASRFAPPGLEAQLSGSGRIATPVAPPQAQPAPNTGISMPQAAPPVVMPGAVMPVVPGVAAYPGAAPYGAAAPTYGYGSAAPGYGPAAPPSYGYAPGYGAGYVPGYGTAYAPGYGAGYAPGYGAGYAPGYGTGYAPGYGTGYAPGYGAGWPGTGFGSGTGLPGMGSGWPGTGFSPFGFW